MDLRQLRYFDTIVRCASFTRAAEALHVAQPALSIAMRKLEEELGVTLLARHDRGIRPTEEGSALLRHARRILGSVEEARRDIESRRGLERGELRIGLPTMLGASYFSDRIVGFRALHPGIAMVVVAGGAPEIAAMVEEGELDLAVVTRHQAGDGLEFSPLPREEMVLCVPDGHRLAGQPRVTAADLADEPLVTSPPGYHQRGVLESMLRTAGAPPPRIALQTNMLPLMKQAVRAGIGVATFLRMAVNGEAGLVALSFEPPIMLDIGLCWRAEREPSLAERAFMAFLRDHP